MSRKKEIIEVEVKEKDSKENLQKDKHEFSTASLIMALIGVILLFLPEATNKVIGYIIGGAFFTAGAITIVKYFKSEIKLSTMNLASGILYALLGLIIILNPLSIMKLATIIFGIYLIVNGVLKIYNAYMTHDITSSYWKGMLISGTIITIFGLILIINPFSGLMITKVAGAFLLIVSIFDIINSCIVKK